jgi:hypothetical protein
MRMPRRLGCLATLFGLLLFVALAYGAIAVFYPWSLHIGGRSTPLMYWSGSGKLLTTGGTYPLYVSLFPSSEFSQLSLDGLRPSGGVQGSGSLCTSRGVIHRLNLNGTIYGGWWSTDIRLMKFNMIERKIFDPAHAQGFTLYGRWRGPELVMDDRGEFGSAFGLKIEHTSATLDWGPYSDFEAACMNAPAH